MTATDYETFVGRKLTRAPLTGFNPPALSSSLFDFQADLTQWALRRGRAAIFASTGLGKTRMQVEWARRVCDHTGRPVLILAPLAVARQTVAEGAAMGKGHARTAFWRFVASWGALLRDPSDLGYPADEFKLPKLTVQQTIIPADKGSVRAAGLLFAEEANTLSERRARGPLRPLGAGRRGMKLWSKRGDTVLSPFAGIGSEGVVAVEEGRRYIGVELKESYYKQACANMLLAREGGNQLGLFDARAPVAAPAESEEDA